MSTDGLRDRIRAAREPLVGTFMNLGSPLATEACALAGFDWLLADLEHGGGDETALTGQLLAAEAHGVPCLVRVESHERIRCGRVLDLGAAGVMFPRVDSAQDAEAVAGHLRYPPAGDRGVATYNRSAGFGVHAERLETANDTVVGVVQIESVGGLEAVEAIAAVPGVDVLFVGPRDLSHAMGIPGQTQDPAFQAALRRVVAAARDAGVAAGILVGDAAAARAHAELGFTFVGIGSDSAFVVAAGRGAARAFAADAS